MPIFNNIRQSLIPAEGAKKYVLYAIGEILLVVIGIVIALQINNWNEDRKAREVELVYLKNIRHDLEASIKELNTFIAIRKGIITSSENVVSYYEGKPVEDWNQFNKEIVDVYSWDRFFQIDHTFQEMSSSGNLAIISNPDIKNGLLELDESYKKLKFKEDHLRYDCEKCLFEPSYGMLEIHEMADNYHFQVSNGKAGKLGKITAAHFEQMLKDKRQKNGFVFVGMYMNEMDADSKKIIKKCEELIKLIDAEQTEK